jgi:hypothetical protein
MKNIHVSISDLAYFRARVWAAERETSISPIVAYLLETLPQIKRANAHNPVAVSAKSPVQDVRDAPGLFCQQSSRFIPPLYHPTPHPSPPSPINK